MPDPLTVLLDAVWIEAMWWSYRIGVGRYALSEHGVYWHPEPDSISGRNVFWVTVNEGKAMTLDLSSLAEALKWEYAYQECGCERAGVERTQFLHVIACYEVIRPNSRYGFITWRT